MQKIVLIVLGFILGAISVYAYTYSSATASHNVTYRLEGPQGCRVRVAYQSGGLAGTTENVEGLLPWETSVNLKGGEVASVSTTGAVGGSNCAPSACSILIDGKSMVTSTAPTCQRVIGWMW